MNEWVKKSIHIANGNGYLDRLHEVYPVTVGFERPVSPELREQIRKSYDDKNKKALIDILIKLEKFPIKDPYVAFLKKKRGEFVKKNPKTVVRIADRLLQMDFEEVLEGIEEPKEFNRQIGTLFKKWLKTLCYPMLPELEFKKSREICLLDGTDTQLKAYANEKLGCKLEKGPDLLARVNDKFILGEAKFLTDTGGHQNAQFQDAFSFLKDKSGRCIKIAILDGVVWIKSGGKMFKTVSKLKTAALSALLLQNYLEELLR